MIPTTRHSGKDKTRETVKKYQLLPKVKGERMNRLSTQDFQGNEDIINDTSMIDICHYILSKLIEYTTPGMNPNVNYGLRVIMIYQHKFNNCNKCITLAGDIKNRETIHLWVQRIYRKISVLFVCSFAVNLKML